MSELYGEYNDVRAREFDIAQVSESISGDSTKVSYWLLIIFAIAFIVFDVVETGLAYRDLYKTAKKDSCTVSCEKFCAFLGRSCRIFCGFCEKICGGLKKLCCNELGAFCGLSSFVIAYHAIFMGVYGGLHGDAASFDSENPPWKEYDRCGISIEVNTGWKMVFQFNIVLHTL